jgi:DNA-binding beta-propeller fold protein YncE
MGCFKTRFAHLVAVVTLAAALVTTGQNSHAQEIGERGFLLATSYNNSTVCRYDAATGIFLDVFVPRHSGGLRYPWAAIVSPNDGNLLVTSTPTYRRQFRGVLRYDGETGEFIDEFVDRSDVTTGYFAVTFGPDGNVYAGERLDTGEGVITGVGAIARFDGETGELIDLFVPPGSGGLGANPVAHVFGPSGTQHPSLDLYVSDEDNDRVLRYDGETGEFLETFVESGSGGLGSPFGLVFGPDGNLYVADSGVFGGTPSVLRFQGPKGKSPGAFLDAFVPAGSGGLMQPLGLLFGPDANGDGNQDLYVNSQAVNPYSFFGEPGTSSVKLYDGVTGDYIADFVPVEENEELESPTLMTFTDSHPVTLEYLGD